MPANRAAIIAQFRARLEGLNEEAERHAVAYEATDQDFARRMRSAGDHLRPLIGLFAAESAVRSFELRREHGPQSALEVIP